MDEFDVWSIDSDSKADWAIRKIAQAQAEYDRLAELAKQRKDGSKMGVGCPEYILLFRKLPTNTGARPMRMSRGARQSRNTPGPSGKSTLTAIGAPVATGW